MRTITLATLVTLAGMIILFAVDAYMHRKKYRNKYNTRKKKLKWFGEMALTTGIVTFIVLIVTFIVVGAVSVFYWPGQKESSFTVKQTRLLYPLPDNKSDDGKDLYLVLWKDKDGRPWSAFNSQDDQGAKRPEDIRGEKDKMDFKFIDTLSPDQAPYLEVRQKISCATDFEYQGTWLFSQEQSQEPKCSEDKYEEWIFHLHPGTVKEQL